MADSTFSTPFQPFFRLAQNNAAVWARLAWSPEVLTQMTRGASAAMQTGEASAPDEGAAHAMNETVRGLVDNYTEFAADMMRSSLNLMVQTQSLWLGSARHAAAAAAASVSRVMPGSDAAVAE